MKPFEIIYVVSVNKIHKKEVLLIAVGSIIATFAFYFLLKALNTNELIVSTLSLIFSLIASYLMLRRNKYYALAFLADDIVSIVMWSLVIASIGISYLPTLICFCVYLINDVYGFIHWIIEEKKQGSTAKKE